VTIGDRFICQPGAVIGADGFSFVTPEKSGVEEIRETLGSRAEIKDQSWTRIHSLGAVTIGDDVEIGANVCIDRGTIRDTQIGSGTKARQPCPHRPQRPGRAGLPACADRSASPGRPGSATGWCMGGQCGVNDNIFVGNDVIAGGATKIFTNAPAGRVLLGYPAVKMETHVEMQKALRRLPRLAARVAALEKGGAPEAGQTTRAER
jgi:UDP-3-O-[3-hydroxymyristoyl] glucosamine N-acyltransferase